MTVVTDPPVASVGYTIPSMPAHAVTISHNHPDHNNSAGVSGSPAIVDGRPVTARQEITVAGTPFLLIPGFHDNQNGAQRGQNTIIRWTMDGVRFAHFGDYGQDQLTAEQLADLRGVEVIFVPAGGFFTIEPARVAALIAQVSPRIAVLMHFRTALGGPAQLAPFPAVVAPYSDFVYAGSTLQVNPAALSASAPTQIVLMHPQGDGAAVNAASFAPGAPVAPGSLVSLFGSFAGSVTAAATEAPLPRRIGETDLLVNGAAVPLLYVSPTQINFQAPRQLATGQFLAEARVGGQRVARAALTSIHIAPGIFAVLNQDGTRNSAANLAARGSVIQIFATGQGEVSPVVEDGAVAPSAPLSVAPILPQIDIGFRHGAVQFTGLAPGFAGLWQINVQIPVDAATGEVPLTVIQAIRSNTVSLFVR